MKSIISVAALAAVTGLSASIASASITIPTVPVGNAGNVADSSDGDELFTPGVQSYGSVAYTYNIAQTEVTNAQYTAFLNAKAATDTHNLYNTNMAGGFGGITRTGSAGSYSYATESGRENNPVNFVSFWDATRFANWLHNGQGNGDTETGAYTLGGVTSPSNTSITRNANWLWAVTSEDEWYKAAYHQPAGAGGDADDFWQYPTSSNSVPTNGMANIGSSIGNTTPVGSYAANYYGAFDMGGNVAEWNEAIAASSLRGVRGGSFANSGSDLGSGLRLSTNRTNENELLGFRVVQIPAPSSVALLAIGGLAGARRRRGGR